MFSMIAHDAYMHSCTHSMHTLERAVRVCMQCVHAACAIVHACIVCMYHACVVDMLTTLCMPAGLRRRGATPTAINNFCREIGITRNENVIPMHKLEHHMRTDLDVTSPRTLAVLRPLKVRTRWFTKPSS